jgi:hypothetical protein
MRSILLVYQSRDGPRGRETAARRGPRMASRRSYALPGVPRAGRSCVVPLKPCDSSVPATKTVCSNRKHLWELTPGERVALIVVAPPDPRRWDLDRLAKSGTGEDRELAEQGLAEWADALDREDHS